MVYYSDLTDIILEGTFLGIFLLGYYNLLSYLCLFHPSVTREGII